MKLPIDLNLSRSGCRQNMAAWWRKYVGWVRDRSGGFGVLRQHGETEKPARWLVSCPRSGSQAGKGHYLLLFINMNKL
jgi:hypothetical protein